MAAPTREIFERAEISSAEKYVVYTFSDVGLVEKLRTLGLGFFEDTTEGASAATRGDAGDGLDRTRARLLRHRAALSISDLKEGERIAFARAKKIAIGFFRDQDRCEKSHLFVGPLKFDELHVTHGDEGFLGARAYLASLFGARKDGVSTVTTDKPSAKTTPPEQLDGAPWDNAANRYVIALALYRMLAGHLPEEGRGARAALSMRRGDVLPLPEDVARDLPPGVHAFVLRAISADASQRPASARECLRVLEEEHAPRVALATSDARSAVKNAESYASGKHTKRRIPRAWSIVGAILALGVALFAVAPLVLGKDSGARESSPPHALVDKPMTDTNAEACASCHPRETAEWKRSVMSHAATSPLFGALESAVEEQIGKSFECPNGAGVLRKRGGDACIDRRSGIAVTGSGGEHWCVNCHLPGENISASAASIPAWTAFGNQRDRAPVRDLAARASLEGISCASCHTTIGPAHGSSGYVGNASWTSFKTGEIFLARPEDVSGKFGIGNSGYALDRDSLITRTLISSGARVHKLPSVSEKNYLKSSEFCGACHDVRLFGTDSFGVRERGEHFKRLRNGYSEWRAWADDEARAGRRAATCQDCHMSSFPGICVHDATNASRAEDRQGCPPGTKFSARAPGERGVNRGASHDFTSVEIPLSLTDAIGAVNAKDDDTALDADGAPLGLSYRQAMLVARALSFRIGKTSKTSTLVHLPIDITNVGAGHRVPAGFSQEREIWVELSVRDADGRTVYEVGHVGRADEDLADKRFLRVRSDESNVDRQGRPLGTFGADVVDGPDAPQWKKIAPNEFSGRGLVNLQNGFLRCVRCIGNIDQDGKCQPNGDQGRTRADRFDDGDYDLDTGECRSNLSFENAFFETYFPVGALDADRGVVKAPDAIIDTRSAAPGVDNRYTYEIDSRGHAFPWSVHAKLCFRAFPPYLLRAFAEVESRKNAEGKRPSGPQVTSAHLGRLVILDLHEAEAKIE